MERNKIKYLQGWQRCRRTLGASYRILCLRAVKAGKDFLKLAWETPKDADGYVVYSAPCNADGATYAVKKMAVIKDGDVDTWVRRDMESGVITAQKAGKCTIYVYS